MNKVVLIVLTILANAICSEATCKVMERAIKDKNARANKYSLCLENPCDPVNSVSVNQSNLCPDWCKILDGICYSKQISPSGSFRNNAASILQIQAQMGYQDSATDDVTGDQRFLSFPGFSQEPPPLLPPNSWNSDTDILGSPDLFSSILSGYGQQRFGFPHNCDINLHDATSVNVLMDPPVDIPYCLRIPCQEMDPRLEFDPMGCLANPGCYYDHELAYRRQSIAGALAGVPVCHLAIRNTNFHRLANEYTQRVTQPWNSLFTRCLVEQNLVAIENPHPGCFALHYLLYMKVYPKIAGWKGMSRRDCFLINGCWLPSSGDGYYCYHPADVDAVQVQAEGDVRTRSGLHSQYEVFGKPICRPFVTATPQEYLNSYRQCKQTGCVVDSSITSQSLNEQFLKLVYSDEVPESLRFQFWSKVQENTITAVNYQEELTKMKREVSCPNISNLFRLQGLGQLAAFQFSNRYFDTVVQPLKQNVKEMKSKMWNFNQSIQSRCRTLAAQILRQNSPPFVRQVFDILCTSYDQVQLACPYASENVNLTGYPPLTGSVEGCCERHLCYLPRTVMTEQRSGIALFFSDWVRWGSCSSSCGGGVRTRTRKCVKHLYEPEQKCTGVTEETEDCNTQSCPYWGAWGQFGPCSVTCGTGIQSRSRTCFNEPSGGCEGVSNEAFPCVKKSCPVYGEWSEFSECPCQAPRTQERTRVCIDNCEGQSQYEREERPCTRFCGNLTCEPTGNCAYPLCRKTLKCECKPDGYLCNSNQPEPERCFDGFCRFF